MIILVSNSMCLRIFKTNFFPHLRVSFVEALFYKIIISWLLRLFSVYFPKLYLLGFQRILHYRMASPTYSAISLIIRCRRQQQHLLFAFKKDQRGVGYSSTGVHIHLSKRDSNKIKLKFHIELQSAQKIGSLMLVLHGFLLLFCEIFGTFIILQTGNFGKKIKKILLFYNMFLKCTLLEYQNQGFEYLLYLCSESTCGSGLNSIHPTIRAIISCYI